MRRSRIVISLIAVVVAIVIQTTVFAAGRIEPLGVAPALVMLVLIGVAPHIETEYLVLLGFTAGILVDLIGSGTLGLWAMAYTAVAYVAGRFRSRFSDSVFMSLVAALALTIFGGLVYVFLGTLFGQETVGEPNVVAKIVLPGVWNLVLAYPVFWVLRYAFAPRDRKWAS